MRHLSLAFLGGFHVTLDGRTIDAFGSDKARALLAYLAIENRHPHRRTALAGLFWPDLSEKKAAHNLSQTLLRLRSALSEGKANPSPTQPFLLITRQMVQLNPHSSYQSDVAAFTDLLRACDQHHLTDRVGAANCTDCTGWMQKAAELYCGDLLAGFFVRESQTLEQWRLVQQEALQIQAVEALKRLADYFERRGEYDQVQNYAYRRTIMDPWCEDAHLQLMRALAAKGQTAAALDHYELYRRTLANELGIEPSQEAANLYQHIRLGGGLSSSEPSGAETSPSPSGQAELRQITALICSRCGRTAKSDPEEQYQQMKDCRRGCIQTLKRFGGYLSQRQGNECLVYFGYPIAVEDAARRAVHAGLAMASSDSDDPVQVSIHTGWMVIGEKRGRRSQDRELIGETPNLARDFHKLARPGSVLISAETERLVRGWFDYQETNIDIQFETGGWLRLYPIWKESGLRYPFEQLAKQAALSAFTGREREMEQLAACLRKTAHGTGQNVFIRGEPGIGKSRLLWELRKRAQQMRVGDEPQPLWVYVRCTQYDQNVSLHPLVRLVEQLLGIQPLDSPAVWAETGTAALAQEFPEDPTAAWLLANLLDLPYDAQFSPPNHAQLRELTHTAVVRFLQKRAAAQPLVVVIEDLQWSDAETIDWLIHAFDALLTCPCLLLLTARSTFDPPWLPVQSATRMDLTPLSREQAAEMAAGIAGQRALAPDWLENTITRADGIPLYLEELIRSHLCADEAGEIPSGVAAWPDLPPGLRDVLAARLDYLGPARAAAQWAAVMGRQFSYPIILGASQMDAARLEHDLKSMQAAGIIYPVGAPADQEYAFRQALVREAACISLLKSTRLEYQQRISETLERVRAAVPENEAGEEIA